MPNITVEISKGRTLDQRREFVAGEGARGLQALQELRVELGVGMQKDAEISAEAAKASYEFAKPDYSTDGAVDPKGLEAWVDLAAKRERSLPRSPPGALWCSSPPPRLR